jgi:23S rRNA G2445 N2-methylase RlmL
MASFFATAAKGTEVALRDELRERRFRGVRADRGGVHFEGSIVEGYRACFELSCAMRILVELDRFDAPDEHALYQGISAIEWSPHLSEKTTLAVRASTRSSRLTHSQYVAQKTKDAVVDQLRRELGARPSVDLEDPDVVIAVHLAKDVATVYLDLSGQPLFQRGYRVAHQGAPLKETLAASLLRLAGRDVRAPFLDPMCGSGTLAIEAALASRNIVPGLSNPSRRFGFQRWRGFGDEEATALREITERARARVLAAKDAPPIFASDIDEATLRIARDSAARAGVEIDFRRADVGDLARQEPVTIVTNPPYGGRMSITEADQKRMGRALASVPSSPVAIITADRALFDHVPLRPQKILQVMNGDLECSFASFRTRP